MNINRVRMLLILVNFGLAGLTGFMAYKEIKAKDARSASTKKFLDDVAGQLAQVTRPKGGPSGRAAVDASTIDLTGSPPPAPKTETKPNDPVESKLVGIPLDPLVKILTITWSARQAECSVAMVKKPDKEPGAERFIYGINEVVPFANNAVIKEIRQREVLFWNVDHEEVLPILDKPPEEGGGAKPGPSGTSSRPTADGSQPIETYIDVAPNSNVVKIRAGGDKAFARDGERALDGVTFDTTELSDGKKALRVAKIPPGSVLAKFGAQDGDVLISVDGKPMSSKAEVVDYVKKNPGISAFEVQIQRKGAVVSKRVVIER